MESKAVSPLRAAAAATTPAIAAGVAGGDPAQEMKDYFSSLNSDGGFCNTECEALAMILDRINQDCIVEPARDFYAKANVGLRKKMLSILIGRIPENERMSSCGPSKLKDWMRRKNCHRAFMFYNKDALVRMAARTSSGMVLSMATYEEMISQLISLTASSPATPTSDTAGAPPTIGPMAAPPTNPSHVTMVQAITKGLLERSFMKPLKGHL